MKHLSEYSADHLAALAQSDVARALAEDVGSGDLTAALVDARRMARASQTSFQLDSSTFPVADPERLNECVRWGDDYQLLFTAPPGTALPVAATRIGTVEPQDFAPLWVDSHVLTPLDGIGYQH